jgi:1-acyl-sn-glycerol-3-phosphate acyltransferase
MNTFLLFLRTIFTYIIVSIAIAIAFVPCFFIACLPQKWRYDNRVYYWFTNLVYKAAVYGSLVPVTVEGKENLPKDPAIFVANHQSAFDIPLLGFLVNGAPHVWLFLVRYAKIPLFGFVARRMNVVVDHSGLRKLVGSLEKAVDIVKERKSHLMLFPEGGRYIDGEIHSFFYGFAILAKGTGRPVFPVMMYNVGEVYPPYAFFIRPFPIRLVIGKPFIFQIGETEEEFVKRVHAWFLEQTGK